MSRAKWFKPRRYGYGSMPTTWQGWVVVIGFVLLVLALFAAEENGAISQIVMIALIVAVTVPFLLFVRAKTDGQWKWRWGSQD
jgi:hypothetical protein